VTRLRLDAALVALLALALIVGGLALAVRVASWLFWGALGVYVLGLLWGLLSRVFRDGSHQGRDVSPDE
jgi:apolipoprotein N-acyltransferase